MSKSLLLGSITYSLLLIGIASVRGEFIALALPFVVYLFAGFLFTPDKIKLEATRHLSTERTSPNSEIDVTVTVTNRGSHLEEVLLNDVLPADLKIRSGQSRHLIRLPKDSTYTFSYKITGPRGGYGYEMVKAQINDHLRLTSREVRIEAKGQLFIFPPIPSRMSVPTIRSPLLEFDPKFPADERGRIRINASQFLVVLPLDLGLEPSIVSE